MTQNHEPEFWVEADKALLDHNKVIGYGVWHINAKGGRECVKRFSVTRKGGWEVALYLANTMRDDLNKPEDFVYDPDKMFPSVLNPHTLTD